MWKEHCRTKAMRVAALDSQHLVIEAMLICVEERACGDFCRSSSSPTRGLCLDASRRALSCCSRSTWSELDLAVEVSAASEPRRSARVGMML